MSDAVLYPVELIRAITSVRTVSDVVIMILTFVVLWHTSVVVKSEAEFTSKLANILGNWTLLLVMYIFTYSLAAADIIRINMLRFLYSTVNLGIPWTILVVKAGDVVDWIGERLGNSANGECTDNEGHIITFGGLVATASMIPVGARMLPVLAGLLLYAVVAYMIAERNERNW